MTKEEFIKKIIGVPWINRGKSFEGVDCYGLVWLYYKEVLDITLPAYECAGEYTNEEFINHWQTGIDTGNWQETQRPERDGIVLTAYRGDRPCHVALVIDSVNVLHCTGMGNASARINSIKTLKCMHSKITFHRYRGHND